MPSCVLTLASSALTCNLCFDMQAAAEKHAAVGGLDGAIRQREAAAEERAKALAAERDVASQRIDALLATHSLKRGTPEWRELGQTAYDVDAFLAGRAQRKPSHASAKKKEKEIKALVVAATKKRSRQRAQWRDPGADGILKTAADAEGPRMRAPCVPVCLLPLMLPSALLTAAVEMALARAMRGKLLREACAYACVTDADMQPATSAMWGAPAVPFVCCICNRTIRYTPLTHALLFSGVRDRRG